MRHQGSLLADPFHIMAPPSPGKKEVVKAYLTLKNLSPEVTRFMSTHRPVAALFAPPPSVLSPGLTQFPGVAAGASQGTRHSQEPTPPPGTRWALTVAWKPGIQCQTLVTNKSWLKSLIRKVSLSKLLHLGPKRSYQDTHKALTCGVCFVHSTH